MLTNPIPNATGVQLVNYVYENNPIPFMVNGSVMIDATKMARPFGKRPAKWLELPVAKEFISTLTAIRKSDTAFVVTKVGGHSGGGTWFHEDVALEFARWLSPAFSVWCNDRIKEILLARVNGTPLVQSMAINITEKDKEIAKWKSLFFETLETVKSMHESNKLAQNSFNVFYSMMEGSNYERIGNKS